MEIGIDANPLKFIAALDSHYFYAPKTPEWREMAEQSAWDDLSWPASTMSFATFYQDVKLAQKALEEATRTRTGDPTFKIDTPNKFETLKRAITRGTKGVKGLYVILKETVLLFTFACAALSQSFARSGNYSVPSVDPFFTNNTDYSAAQAGWWWLENAAPAA